MFVGYYRFSNAIVWYSKIGWPTWTFSWNLWKSLKSLPCSSFVGSTVVDLGRREYDIFTPFKTSLNGDMIEKLRWNYLQLIRRFRYLSRLKNSHEFQDKIFKLLIILRCSCYKRCKVLMTPELSLTPRLRTWNWLGETGFPMRRTRCHWIRLRPLPKFFTLIAKIRRHTWPVLFCESRHSLSVTK